MTTPTFEMLRDFPFAQKLARLNRRQRKKLRVGEFQKLVFEVRIRFHRPMEGMALDGFLDELIELIESHHLAMGGFGGRVPLMETDGIVSAWGRGSPTGEDRQTVLNWLQQCPEVASAEGGAFVDGWYGWEVPNESQLPQDTDFSSHQRTLGRYNPSR